MNHQCVNYFSSKTGKVYDWDFSRDGETLNIPTPACLAVNDSTVYTSAGLTGLGIVQMATVVAHPLIASGRMEVILPGWTTAPLPVNAVYPQNRHLSAKVRVFVEWVADLFLEWPQQEKKA
jgi:LysR family transcriptional regulator for bpeEF and oprC